MSLMTTWMLLSCLFCTHSMADQKIVNNLAAELPLSAQGLSPNFPMQKSYRPDGHQMHAFIYSPSSERPMGFCLQQLHMMPYTLQRRWDRVCVSVIAGSPLILSSEVEMKTLTSQPFDGIDYIDHTVFVMGGAYVYTL
jgi:hypothetical protein